MPRSTIRIRFLSALLTAALLGTGCSVSIADTDTPQSDWPAIVAMEYHSDPRIQKQLLDHLSVLNHYAQSTTKHQASDRAAELQLSRLKSRELLQTLGSKAYLVDQLEMDWSEGAESKAQLTRADSLADSVLFNQRYERLLRFHQGKTSPGFL